MSLNLQYPIGKFIPPTDFDAIGDWINTIASFPEKLSALVAPLTDEQKSWQYRPQSWTIAQIVHHCADSHINSYVRLKWALTEDNCIIKDYNEKKWATLNGAQDSDLGDSLLLLKSLHKKWTSFLLQLSTNELERTYWHPASKETIMLKTAVATYAWHCEHHLAHIKLAIDNKGIC